MDLGLVIDHDIGREPNSLIEICRLLPLVSWVKASGEADADSARHLKQTRLESKYP
jgi:hypothetical protein